MPIDIGVGGERRAVVFGSGNNEHDRQMVEAFERNQFEAFDTDARQINAALKNEAVMRRAVSELTIPEIARRTDLKERFVERCLEYHGIISPPEGRDRPKYAPWEPRPHPDEVATGGDYTSTPWGGA